MIALVLVACMSEAEFRVEADAAVCDWKSDCYGESYEVCIDEASDSWEPVDESCVYDAQEARRCVVGLEELGCPDALDDMDEEFGFPTACDAVWDC